MTERKITELTAASAITTDDLLVIVDTPATSPTTLKITWANILAYFATGTNTLTLSNAGLHLLGTGGTYDVIIAPIETGGALAADRTLNLDLYGQNRTLGLQSSLYVTGGTTAGRTLTFATGDANRTVTIGNNNMPLHAANVRAYGAVGDGVTDDTAAFTAALAANNWVYVPNGTYSVSQITLPTGKWLVGESRERTIIADNGGAGTAYDGSRCLLYIVDVNQSGIANLKFLGRGEGSYDDIAIVVHAGQYFKAHDIWVDNFQGRGIFIAHDYSRYQEWRDVWISRIYDTDGGLYGIGLWLYGGGGYGGPRNNVFHGVHTELTDDAGIALDAGTTSGVGDSPNDNQFSDANILNPCRVRGAAISLQGAKNTLVDGFTIDYLTTTDTAGISMSIDQTGETCVYNRVVNGILRYCGGQPIVFTSSSYNTLENVLVEEVGLSGNRPLVLLQSTTINGGGSGGGCTGNTVRGIRVRQSASSNYTYGVEFDATTEDMLSNRFQMIDWGTYASGLYHVTGGGSVPFTGTTANSFLPDSFGTTDLYVDVVNHRVGIGTGSPSYAVHVLGSANALASATILTKNTLDGTYAYTGIYMESANSTGFLLTAPSNCANTFHQDRVVLGAASDAAGICIDAGNANQTVVLYVGAATETARFTIQGLMIGGATAGGTSGTGLLVLKSGTAPSGGNPADAVQMYSADQAAGNACPHFQTENGTVVKLYAAGSLTQTYSTADATLSAYSPDDESGAYSGIDNAQAGSVYAKLDDLNALRAAYETLRAFTEDLAKFTNSLVDALQATGLIG